MDSNKAKGFTWRSEANDSFINATNKQVEALQTIVKDAISAFNDLEKLSFETQQTLVIKIGEREIRQPIAFKIQIE